MMSIWCKLFLMFAKLCAFAFGGGYVMIPSLIRISEENHWATASELTDVIAIAGMAPGPVAVNAAVAYGFKIAHFPGAMASFMGIAIPCAVIVILVAKYFFRMYENKTVQAVLYGLRPVIVGIILYAAAGLAIKNGMVAPSVNNLIKSGININCCGIHLFELKSLIIAAITVAILSKTRIQPIYLIISSGILGALIF